MPEASPALITKQSTVSVALMFGIILAVASAVASATVVSSKVDNMKEDVTEIKSAITAMQSSQVTLSLVLERMQQDDAREVRDAADDRKRDALIAALAERLRTLETK